MKILDSNILIYSYQTEFRHLRYLILAMDAAISEITRLEVLGFHGLTTSEEEYFTNIFEEIRCLPIDQPILEEAIKLRKKYKLKLGDSIVAATAMLFGGDLTTRNEVDFSKIVGLKITNPIDI